MSALIPINNINVNFEVVNDEVFATSLQIAEVFEKRHDLVLRAIDNLPNDDFKNSNFKFDTYFDKKGEQRRMLSLTRDGFSLLVMGFTGEKAYQWKIEFIKAFNMMEAELRRQGIVRYTDKIAELDACAKLEAKRVAREISSYKSQLSHKDAFIAELTHKLESRDKKINELATRIVLFDDHTYNPAFKELESLKDDMTNMHYKLTQAIIGVKEKLIARKD